MKHHAFVIPAEEEEGISEALRYAQKELGMKTEGNRDVAVFRYGLLSVEDVRKLQTFAAQGALTREGKVVVISARRLYHESQNALLKLFEEPPRATTLFLIVPSVGMLLPTLRSRVQVLAPRGAKHRGEVPEAVLAFIKMSVEKRSAYIKKLASGKDEDERRHHRDEAIELINGIEALAAVDIEKNRELLSDVAELRTFLHDRSAPVRMILEHVSLSLPKNLGR